MAGRLRWLMLVPTESMTADSLTKSMVAEPMMRLLSSGTMSFKNEPGHPIVARSLPKMTSIEEKHFDMTDHELIKNIAKGIFTVGTCASTRRFICMALLVTSVDATSSASSSTPTATTTEDNTGWLFIFSVAAIIIVMERVITHTIRLWWRHLTSEATTATSSTTRRNVATMTSGSDPASNSVATDTDDELLERDNTTLMYVSDLEAEGLQLRQRNEYLEREVTEL